jgi:hypothetical protein
MSCARTSAVCAHVKGVLISIFLHIGYSLARTPCQGQCQRTHSHTPHPHRLPPPAAAVCVRVGVLWRSYVAARRSSGAGAAYSYAERNFLSGNTLGMVVDISQQVMYTRVQVVVLL